MREYRVFVKQDEEISSLYLPTKFGSLLAALAVPVQLRFDDRTAVAQLGQLRSTIFGGHTCFRRIKLCVESCTEVHIPLTRLPGMNKNAKLA